MQRIHVTIRPLNREDSVLYFPPEAFGPFRVLHQIGAGTLGPVFRAYEPGRDRLVAVKVFRLDLTPEQTSALVAELETLVAAGISHPRIAAPIAAGIEHGAVYLAQEYAIGESLDAVLRDRGPLPMHDVVDLVDCLAGAIDHAASRGVRHGSLHPRDIVVNSGSPMIEGVSVAGFGIAAAVSKVGGQVPVRPQYTALDTPSDVYSLGAIAFEAATGTRVSPDNLESLEVQQGVGLRRAFEVPLAAPDATAGLAIEFARVLREHAGAMDAEPTVTVSPEQDLSTEPPSPSPESWSPQPPRALQPDSIANEAPVRPRRIVVLTVACAVLAALAVGLFLRSQRQAPSDAGAASVDETTVELPATAPAAPVPAAPIASAAPVAPKAPPPTPSRPASGAARRAQTGRLLIRSTPDDADVTVNGRARGKTPLVLRDLALGSYTIRVARDGYAPEERTLQLTANQPSTSTTIDLRRSVVPGPSTAKTGPAGLTVQSRPAGARVFVNERLAGSTPVAIPDVPEGSATVRIELDGYQPWVTTVRVGAGEQVRVAASLERE